MTKTKIIQKDVWKIILEKHETWSEPSYYNHVQEVVKLIESDNNVKIPIEWVFKLHKRYKKMRDKRVK